MQRYIHDVCCIILIFLVFIFIKIIHAHNFKNKVTLQGLLLKAANPDHPYPFPAPQTLPVFELIISVFIFIMLNDVTCSVLVFLVLRIISDFPVGD